jgi:hypothetical protein
MLKLRSSSVEFGRLFCSVVPGMTIIFLLQPELSVSRLPRSGSVSRISDQGMESIVSAVSRHLALRNQGKSSELPCTPPGVI